MEWYFGNEVEDIVVPKDYEQSEMISSPENWSDWGINGFEDSSFTKKNNNSNINMTREEKSFYDSIHMADSNNNEILKSNNSSMNQELYNNGGVSDLWNDEADFQQFSDEEARINHMDDIFFNSLLEDDPTKDSNETRDNTNQCNNNDNIFEGNMINLHTDGSDEQNNGSSKYLKTHDFSPSTDWGNGDGSTYEIPMEYASNENSMEESVLNDLERVTAQFTDKTRMCFRDAFYRLAESSKQFVTSSEDGEPIMTSNDDTSRVGETEDSESKTNVIDRAVANLMFHKFDFEENDTISCYQNQMDHNDDAQVPTLGTCRNHCNLITGSSHENSLF